MATERMYELAFRYREARLWKTLSDTALYAVALPDGEIGYCSVMGMLGEHLSLAVYPGQDGYASYRYAMINAPFLSDHTELICAQDCIQCSFENKDMLSVEEAEEVRAYASGTGRVLRGRNAFPKFMKYRPGRYPWHFDAPEDELRICAALEASLWLAELLKSKRPRALGLQELNEDSTDLPLLIREKEGWEIRRIPLPREERVWPAPVLGNEVITARIRKMKKKAEWECGTFYLPGPVQDPENVEEAPWFPLTLLCADRETGMVSRPVLGKADEPVEMVRELAEMIVAEDHCPRTVYAADDRCCALLDDFCRRCGIRLRCMDGLEQFENARDSLLQHMRGADPDSKDFELAEDWDDEEAEEEKLDQFFETLMKMRDEELKTMPDDFVKMVFNLAEYHLVPDELIKRMKKLFR